MSSIRETAQNFFDACESGKGWEGCQQYCHPDAKFAAQTTALAGIDTLEAYAEWLKSIYTLMPDASYEILSFGVDEARNNVMGFGIFRGTHTGEGGPLPPTNKRVETDYGAGVQRIAARRQDEAGLISEPRKGVDRRIELDRVEGDVLHIASHRRAQHGANAGAIEIFGTRGDRYEQGRGRNRSRQE